MERREINHACSICHYGNFTVWTKASDYNYHNPGEFIYYKCKICQSLWQDYTKLPADLTSYYPATYALPSQNESIERLLTNPVHKHRSSFIEKVLPQKGKLLDIGCGRGIFLEYMRRKGWEVCGIEPSSSHVELVRTMGISVVHDLWPSEKMKGEKFDAITMIHVLEHFTAPDKAIIAAYDALKENGILFIETPNAESIPALIFRRYWVTLDAPRHITIFSKASIRCLLKKWDIISLNTYSPSTMEYTESIRLMLREKKMRSYAHAPQTIEQKTNNINTSTFQTLQKKQYLVSLLHKIEQSAFKTVNFVSDILDAGCNLIILARKK